MQKESFGPLRFVIAVLVITCCIGCDQATKRLAKKTLDTGRVHSYLGDVIRLEYAVNPGGFLSLGSQLPSAYRWFFFVVFNTLVMLLVTGFLLARWNTQIAVFIAAAFILAGGIGNLIDRVTQQGMVTDFINVGIGPLRSGIFNVADMAVLFGAIALVIFVNEESCRKYESSRKYEA